MTLSAVTLPGTSLAESDRMGRLIEETLLAHPEVVATARRTGRAELDEHAQGVEAAELDVSYELGERSKEQLLASLRADLPPEGGDPDGVRAWIEALGEFDVQVRRGPEQRMRGRRRPPSGALHGAARRHRFPGRPDLLPGRWLQVRHGRIGRMLHALPSGVRPAKRPR